METFIQFIESRAKSQYLDISQKVMRIVKDAITEGILKPLMIINFQGNIPAFHCVVIETQLEIPLQVMVFWDDNLDTVWREGWYDRDSELPLP